MSMESGSPDGQIAGRYTANILGTIRSHLEALQGFDAMALELIQNADDAGATDITFDVTDEALVISNSGTFSFCGDLENANCPGVTSHGGSTRSCDFHNITEVASGGKLGDPGNIGRFGIGFISTYQVTDSPEIRSGDLEVQLHPERLEWTGRRVDELSGTRFTLRWAKDEASPVRNQLCLSAITAEHVERVLDDTQTVLERSLLFLRHVRSAHLLRNGARRLSVQIERRTASELRISFDGGAPPQEWLILRASAEDALPPIVAAHSRLAALKRKEDVTIALRVAPAPLDGGLLYAYLPTQQSSGLPLHVNGDFFPTSSRKAAIFEGHQHQQAWNETLIHVAAKTLAAHLELLRDKLGFVSLWELIKAAEEISRDDRSGHPECYKCFWREILAALSGDLKIVLAADDTPVSGRAAMLSKAAPSDEALAVAKNIGLVLVSETLRPFRNWLPHAGVHPVTVERLVSLCERSAYLAALQASTASSTLQTFYSPLWELLDAHMEGFKPDAALLVVERLRKLPVGLTDVFQVCTLGSCSALPAGISPRQVKKYLPWVSIPHPQLQTSKELAKLLPQLSLNTVASHMERAVATPKDAEALLGVDPNHLKGFYALITDFDQFYPAPRELCTRLSALPIWRTGSGFSSLQTTLLPGDFTDPIGLSSVLASDAFDARSKEFLHARLGVKKQSVRVFVETVLPAFFASPDAIDTTRYQTVMIELSDRATLLDDEEVSRALARLPLVPTQDGKWNRPSRTYFRTELLEETLGSIPALWVDEKRLPSRRSVKNLLTSLGIRTQPDAAALVERLVRIAATGSPVADAREASARAFYALGDRLDMLKAAPNNQELAELDKLRTADCLPADDREDKWFRASELYAPYRAAAFESQATILSFKNTQRLNRGLLKVLGIETEPPTNLVVAHLRHCMKIDAAPSDAVYQVLNERAASTTDAVAALRDDACIYDRTLKRYLFPSRLFWSAQRLGQYAYTAPANYDQYRAFLTAVGVRAVPEPAQYSSILLEIAAAHFKSGVPVDGEDLGIYLACLRGLLVEAEVDGAEALPHWRALVENPSILNLLGMPRFPDEVLLLDSEWIHSHFGTDIDGLLCRAVADYSPVFERVNVRTLSSLAKVKLDFTEGQEQQEAALEIQLRERADCVARLLHDKDSATRVLIAGQLRTMAVRSFDQLRVIASVDLDAPFFSEAMLVQAFYESDENRLTLARPLGPRSWPQAFNALFHHFLANDSGSDISKLSAVCWTLVKEDTLEEAHQYLTDIGIPLLVETQEIALPESLALDSLGTSQESEVAPPPDFVVAPESVSSAGLKESSGTNGGTTSEPGLMTHQPSGSVGPDAGSQPSWPADINTPLKPKKRASFKQQWDQALRTYARPRTGEPREADPDKRRHDLAVEASSRKIVCRWESKNGRQAVELAQGHPGYDIISTNSRTGEQRLIEVKGIDGEWNKTGVGLTRTEFANAQEFGDKFWLYVVEWTLDDGKARVHPIRNPATQVERFMFDSGWRDLTEADQGTASDAFMPGARGQFGAWGKGTIVNVQRKPGGAITLVVDVDGTGQRTMTLNLQTMKILGPDDPDEHEVF